ncbi:MAG: methylenetetrahydrofolate reductase [NAD(P)H] [Desulfovibrio sp.]|uniref:methylenetetrahydrofolate reductase [NAD(P)H] n=1 Tax=Desulfovibrio sp. 7SRBS1 TaxID=3378064 RepID=UPI003B417F52
MKIKEAVGHKKFVSLEFFPPGEREAWSGFFEVAEQLKGASPLFVSVTYGAGGGTQDNTLEIATQLKKNIGFEPLVHLTCVGATRERIDGFLNKLSDAGIENILALRGDPPKGKADFVPDNEEFQHASDLVAYIRANHPQFCVGVAGYPEPHPESPSVAEDLRWMKHKVEAGADFIVTQLFFDTRLYFDFVERLAVMDVNVPVIPGVLPIMSLASVRFILSLCNASIPGAFYLDLEKADKEGGAELVRSIGIDFAALQAQKLLDGGAPGVHLYTLNKAAACLDIASRLAL